MVRCSFKIPVEAWRFKDDIWDYMTMGSWLECRGKHCYIFQDFIEDIGIKLNRISSAKNLWNVMLCDDGDNLDITFLTYDDNIYLS